MRRKAFTLVELLVVVAIIALLISILAPSLKSAKDLAKQMICATHLKSIGTGSTLYSEANRGEYPNHKWGATRLNDGVPAPANLCRAYAWNGDPTETPGLLPDGSGRNTPFGIGFLHFTGVVQPDMLYCPMQLQQTRWFRKCYPDPYSLKKLPYAEAGSNVFHAGYQYQPNVTLTSDNSTGYYTFVKAEQMPARAFLAMDIMMRSLDYAHLLAGEDKPMWQVATGGGSVIQKQSDKVYRLIDDLGGWYGGTNDPDAWKYHVQAMGYIQGAP